MITGICSVAEDVSTLYPAGFDVVETDSLPDGFDIYGAWFYKDGVISTVPVDYAALAETERESRIDAANKFISDKQWPSKLTLGRLSDADKSLFNLWLDYLDNLDVASLDLSNVVDEDNYKMIIWPDKPEV